MDGSKAAVVQTAPSVVTGNNTSYSRPTVSTKLAAVDDKSSSRGTKRAIEGRGYSGTLGATVSERMLMFSNASSGSRSNSPMPLLKEEKSKRVLREGWIKKELPKNDDDNVTKITESSGIEGIQRMKDRQISPTQKEKPLILANMNGLHHVASNDAVDDVTIVKMNIESMDNAVSLSLLKDKTTAAVSTVLGPKIPKIPLEIIVPNRNDSSVHTVEDENMSPEFRNSSRSSSSISKNSKNVILIESELDGKFSPALPSNQKVGLTIVVVEDEVIVAPTSVSIQIN